MIKEYDAISVLSGDYVHTDARIRNALGLFYKDKGDKFIFNGFNTEEEHDFGFEGDYNNDLRLIPYIHEIEEIHPIIVYASNTCENAVKLEEKAKEHNLKNFTIVTSDFHVKRCKRIFRKFFSPYSIKFVGIPTARNMKESHKLKIHEKLQEWLCDYYFFGLTNGSDPKKIKNIYKTREKKMKKFLKKILK